MERSRKRRAIKYISFAAAALIAIVAFLYFTGQFGVSQADIEADARESQKIDESWLCVKASEDDVTAMLFYDEFLGDYKVSIYTNPADRPFGSFFLYGGTTNAENEGIAEYLISDSGDRVYMSMNLQNAVLMKISGGQGRILFGLWKQWRPGDKRSDIGERCAFRLCDIGRGIQRRFL